MSRKLVTSLILTALLMGGIATAQSPAAINIGNRIERMGNYLLAMTMERNEYQDLVVELSQVQNKETLDIIEKHMGKLTKLEKARVKAQKLFIEGK